MEPLPSFYPVDTFYTLTVVNNGSESTFRGIVLYAELDNLDNLKQLPQKSLQIKWQLSKICSGYRYKCSF